MLQMGCLAMQANKKISTRGFKYRPAVMKIKELFFCGLTKYFNN
jgi:hypothetical protein